MIIVTSNVAANTFVDNPTSNDGNKDSGADDGNMESDDCSVDDEDLHGLGDLRDRDLDNGGSDDRDYSDLSDDDDNEVGR